MKKIYYILSNMMLGACLLFVSCQDLDEPYSTIPVLGKIETTLVNATSLSLTGSISGKYTKCYFLLSTSQDMSNAVEYTASVSGAYASTYISNLSPNTTYYYVLVVVRGNDEVRGDVYSTTTGDNVLKIGNVSFASGESGEIPTEIGTSIWRIGEEPLNEHMNAKLQKSGDSWSLPYTWEITSQDYYVIYAYAPYDETMSNNEYFIAQGSIPVQTYEYNAIDYLYGSSNEFNTSHTTTDITMHHALAKVIFNFKLAEYYNNDNALITNLMLSNPKEGANILPTIGYLNIRSGAIETDKYSSYGEALRYSSELSINKTTATELVIMSMPTTASGQLTLTLTIDGHTYYQQLSINEETAWKKGKQYSIDVTVNESELIIGDVRVEAWQDNEGVNIPIYD